MRYIFSSLTRISDLQEAAFEVGTLERSFWATDDYVVGEVYGGPSALYRVELSNGRLMPVAEGDLVVGALGKRAATLETTGDWREIDSDGKMAALTGAGLFGRIISRSSLMPPFLKLAYQGHVLVDGNKVGMGDFVDQEPERKLQKPVIEENVRLIVLCASDPYSVVGVSEAFGHRPHLVTGLATNTAAGISLIERLSGISAVNVLDKSSRAALEGVITQKLALGKASR